MRGRMPFLVGGGDAFPFLDIFMTACSLKKQKISLKTLEKKLILLENPSP